MKNKELILVVGASGTVGSELVKQLKAQGYAVRATTSKETFAGDDERVQVNLATGEGVDAAFAGVSRAFLLSPPGYADHYAMLSPLVKAATRHKLKRVVLMTAMGANADESSPFRRAERELESSGLSYNIIRPNWFLQNFHTFWLGGIKAQGKILLPAGNAKVGFVDARDISLVAAKLLTSDEFANRDFDLTGPAAVDHARVATALSAASDRGISYEEISPEALRTGLLGAGLPADYVGFMLLIFGFLREGYSAATNDNVAKITGRAPRSLEVYAKDYAKHFRG